MLNKTLEEGGDISNSTELIENFKNASILFPRYHSYDEDNNPFFKRFNENAEMDIDISILQFFMPGIVSGLYSENKCDKFLHDGHFTEPKCNDPDKCLIS